jgi:hypothetical protein
MTYYDTFELDCGCRMHCRCDKVAVCDSCGTYGGVRHSSMGRFYCIGGCKPKPKVRLVNGRWQEVERV